MENPLASLTVEVVTLYDLALVFVPSVILKECDFPPFTAHPAAPKFEDYRPVNQVHITQVASQKFPLHPSAHPSRNTRRTPRKPQQQQKDFSSESDADPVFSLDDFTNDCEPFFESEEDDLSSGEKSKFTVCDIQGNDIYYINLSELQEYLFL